MGHIPLIDELLTIAAAGLLASLILARLRIPTVAGFLVAGAIVGPSGLGLVENITHINSIAEVGVVLLLFTIGLEFSLARLRPILPMIALGGTLQVGATIAGTALLAWWWGEGLARGVFLGFLVALSSTAIVLRSLAERGELQAPHGRLIVGILIFQDLCVIALVLVIPILAGGASGGAWLELGLALGKATAVAGATMLLSRWLIPRLMGWVDATRHRELFILAVVSLCLGIGSVTAAAGLSLALGAFLAGVVLADTDYQHRAVGDVLPLRDLFTSLFFVSLGMLFDLSVLLQQPIAVAMLFAAFVFGKGFVAVLAAMVMRFPARVALLAGAGLAQFGEFGFVLARLGEEAGLITATETSIILAAGTLSMIVTPLWLKVAPRLTAGEILLRPLERLLGVRGIDEPEAEHEALVDHFVVVGYGAAGRLVCQALHRAEVPYVVMELNAETVRRGRSAGEPVYYGDVTSPEALAHARLDQARALVLLINDPEALRRAVGAARAAAPKVPILARTAFVANAPELHELGANQVVVAEVEAGVQMVSRLVRHLGPAESATPALRLDALEVRSVTIAPDSPALGRCPGDLELPERTWLLAVSRRRAKKFVEQIAPTEELGVGDLVFLVGERSHLGAADVCLSSAVTSRSDRP